MEAIQTGRFFFLGKCTKKIKWFIFSVQKSRQNKTIKPNEKTSIRSISLRINVQLQQQ